MTQPTQAAIVAASAARRNWGIQASISLAQWAPESGWGKHVSASHNYFRMKAKSGSRPRPCQRAKSTKAIR